MFFKFFILINLRQIKQICIYFFHLIKISYIFSSIFRLYLLQIIFIITYHLRLIIFLSYFLYCLCLISHLTSLVHYSLTPLFYYFLKSKMHNYLFIISLKFMLDGVLPYFVLYKIYLYLIINFHLFLKWLSIHFAYFLKESV